MTHNETRQTTTIIGYSGMMRLTGWREQAYERARFNLVKYDQYQSAEVILTNADWPETWKALIGRMTPSAVLETMR